MAREPPGSPCCRTASPRYTSSTGRRPGRFSTLQSSPSSTVMGSSSRTACVPRVALGAPLLAGPAASSGSGQWRSCTPGPSEYLSAGPAAEALLAQQQAARGQRARARRAAGAPELRGGLLHPHAQVDALRWLHLHVRDRAQEDQRKDVQQVHLQSGGEILQFWARAHSVQFGSANGRGTAQFSCRTSSERSTASDSQ